ncbi:MAG: hypothetical protein RIR97_468 [Pseudomonadota bacterium]
MSVLEMLRLPPFSLDQRAIDWVQDSFERLTLRERVSQIFVLLMMGKDEATFKRIADLKPGGVTRGFTGDIAFERKVLSAMNDAVPVPLIITADLEGSRMSLPFGTQVLNPLGLAALDDLAQTEASSAILAREGRAMGVSWSFTPVVDINKAFRSAIVGTRSFGSDIDKIERHAVTQMKIFQANGVAATAKHWPGEGYDDRDQHLVTTINPLSMEEWDATFGRLYRRMIAEGVMSIMSAHIALPAYIRAKTGTESIEAYRPASINRLLNTELLRNELGFNGLIVSDAMDMAGLRSWCPRKEAMPQVIASGCDVILFSSAPEEDMEAVYQAVQSGAIEESRFNDAVMRMLGMKAKMGLFEKTDVLPPEEAVLAEVGSPKNRSLATYAINRSPTLVKDVQSLFPLSIEKHKRVLFVDGGIFHPLAFLAPKFSLPDLLRAEGFDVTMDHPDVEPNADDFDVMLYAFGDESLLTKSHIFIDWNKIGGGLDRAMTRYWHDIPTAIISFGHPYLLYDAPRVPTYVNAYNTLDLTQKAVVECMMGRAEWNTSSPVDAFCGLPDARY